MLENDPIRFPSLDIWLQCLTKVVKRLFKSVGKSVRGPMCLDQSMVFFPEILDQKSSIAVPFDAKWHWQRVLIFVFLFGTQQKMYCTFVMFWSFRGVSQLDRFHLQPLKHNRNGNSQLSELRPVIRLRFWWIRNTVRSSCRGRTGRRSLALNSLDVVLHQHGI